jgi:hypothetical protein
MENNEPLLVRIFDGDGAWTYPVTPNPSILDGYYHSFSEKQVERDGDTVQKDGLDKG